MYGWLLTDFDTTTQFDNKNIEKITYKNFSLMRKHNGRFVNDSIYEETDRYIILLEGTIYNRRELLDSHNQKDWLNLVIVLYKAYGNSFPDLLRGCFSGICFDKQDDSIFAFTNHIGDSGVFYSNLDLHNNHFCISNNVNWIVDTFKANNLAYTLDINAVKYMSTFGYMLDQTTYISEISRLMPGEYLYTQNMKQSIQSYHVFDNTKTIDMSISEIIDELDRLFRQAIAREFDKDLEYGYCSLVDLSGGLDCRIVNYVAKDMGYNNILNISFSQTGSDESKAMLALYRDLGNPLFYVPLDNANHLLDLDIVIDKNYGLSYYAGAGSIMTVLESINLDLFGLEHGGILGDMAEGVFPGSGYTEHTEPSFEAGMPFSYLLGFDMLDKKVLDKYPNTEMFTIAGRGLLAGACTQLLRRHYTGYASPFEDVDFYDFFLSIPLSIRGKGKILDKWILDRYPQAYDIISDSLMCKPSAGEFTKKIKRLQKSIKGKFAQIFSRWYPSLKRNNMNPMEYWYKTNSELRSFIHQYYNDNVDKLDIVPKAKELVAKLFNQGNTTNKLQALTVLGVVKKYF